jgi:hypothetical protein
MFDTCHSLILVGIFYILIYCNVVAQQAIMSETIYFEVTH